MSKWIELLNLNIPKEITPQTGSFGICKLDARCKISTQKLIGHVLMKREHNDVGFRILQGNSLLGTKPIFTYINNKYENNKLSEYM